jgi:glutamate-5-semialdehyde dehydrogenase
VPVIKHYKGVCHVFVDASADEEMALRIVENAKCQRPGVCNALEKVLVHRPPPRLPAPDGRELLAGAAWNCAATSHPRPRARHEARDRLRLDRGVPRPDPHREASSRTSARPSPHQHLRLHHSDTIVTADPDERQKRFLQEVDSAAVYVNASTRFTDGGEFGMGAEIGISTDKLHARGPMGLEELTTYKYQVIGTGQCDPPSHFMLKPSGQAPWPRFISTVVGNMKNPNHFQVR